MHYSCKLLVNFWLLTERFRKTVVYGQLWKETFGVVHLIGVQFCTEPNCTATSLTTFGSRIKCDEENCMNL